MEDLLPKIDVENKKGMGTLFLAQYLLIKYFKSSHFNKKKKKTLGNGEYVGLNSVYKAQKHSKVELYSIFAKFCKPELNIFRSSPQTLLLKLILLHKVCTCAIFLFHMRVPLQLSKSFHPRSIF